MDKIFKDAVIKITSKDVLFYWNGKKNLLPEEIMQHIVADIWIFKTRSYNIQIHFYSNSWKASYILDPAAVEIKSKLPLPCPIQTMDQKVWFYSSEKNICFNLYFFGNVQAYFYVLLENKIFCEISKQFLLKQHVELSSLLLTHAVSGLCRCALQNFMYLWKRAVI